MIKRISRNMKTKNVSRDTIQKIRVEQISPNPNQARIDKELSRQVGKSRTYIAQKVRLLELGTDVRNAMESKKVGEPLSEGAARQLLRLKPIDDLATTTFEDLRWSHLYAHFIISKPNYFRTVADVQFGVDEHLAFLYRCRRQQEASSCSLPSVGCP